MYLSLLLAAAGILSSAGALRHQVLLPGKDSYTETVCLTYYGSQPVRSLPTKSVVDTITLFRTVVVASFPVTTTTPTIIASQTSTTQVTVTATAMTDVFVVTNSVFASASTTTSTITSTSIILASTTTSGKQQTVTVTTPANFIVPHPTTVERIKRDALVGIPLPTTISTRANPLPFGRAAPPRCKNQKRPKYPASVSCEVFIETVVPTTTTTMARVTRTSTAKAVVTTTTIIATAMTTFVPPHVTVVSTSATTLSPTVTVVVTVTTSSTSTQTVTNYPPAATFYAQCSASNLVSSSPDGYPLALDAENAPYQPTFDANDAYGCCVQCATTNNCAGSNYLAGAAALGSQSCQLNVVDDCSPGQAFVAETYYADVRQSGMAFTISNGMCGVYEQVMV